MTSDSEELLRRCRAFSDEVTATLRRTVCPSASIEDEIVGDRIRLAPPKAASGAAGPLPLTIAGEHLVDLHLDWWLTWDHRQQFLSVYESKFSLSFVRDNEPLVRVEYEQNRDYAPAHIQVHGENGSLGWILSHHVSRRPPRLWRMHLPVGDRRFRPCLEDLVEMAVRDLNVDAQAGWMSVVASGRARWKAMQTKAAVRDLLQADVAHADDIVAVVEEAAGDGTT